MANKIKYKHIIDLIIDISVKKTYIANIFVFSIFLYFYYILYKIVNLISEYYIRYYITFKTYEKINP